METLRKRTLDLGCGTGSKNSTSGFTVGTDLNIPSLHEAKTKHPHASYICGDAYRLPFADKVFGAIRIIYPLGSLLEGLESGTIYPELARVSEPDTELTILFDVAGVPMDIQMGARPYFLMYDWKHPTPDELAAYGTRISESFAEVFRHKTSLTALGLQRTYEMKFKKFYG